MNIVSDLIRFLEGSPTCFHAIKNTETELERPRIYPAFRKRSLEPDPGRQLLCHPQRLVPDRIFHPGGVLEQHAHSCKPQRLALL